MWVTCQRRPLQCFLLLNTMILTDIEGCSRSLMIWPDASLQAAVVSHLMLWLLIYVTFERFKHLYLFFLVLHSGLGKISILLRFDTISHLTQVRWQDCLMRWLLLFDWFFRLRKRWWTLRSCNSWLCLWLISLNCHRKVYLSRLNYSHCWLLHWLLWVMWRYRGLSSAHCGWRKSELLRLLSSLMILSCWSILFLILWVFRILSLFKRFVVLAWSCNWGLTTFQDRFNITVSFFCLATC